MILFRRVIIFSLLSFLSPAALAGVDGERTDGWSAFSPRDEIRPEFDFGVSIGRNGAYGLLIAADDRQGLMGHWEKTFPVEGGMHYRFSAWKKTTGVELERRAVIVRVQWLSKDGKRVTRDEPSFASYRPGEKPRAEPEFPIDGKTEESWTEVTSVYRVPSQATKAVVELHFRWGAPNSKVVWSGVSLTPVAPPGPRKVRLATVHYRPTLGETPQ